MPLHNTPKLAPESAPEQPLEWNIGTTGTKSYTYPTSQACLGQKCAVQGHNGAWHLAFVIGANVDGTLTLAIFAHQQFEGQPNESDMGVHFRNNVPVAEIIHID